MNISFGILWTALGGTAASVAWIFTSFAPAADVEALQEAHAEFVTVGQFNEASVEFYYEQFYSNLDKLRHAQEDRNQSLIEELERRQERLKTKICKIDPQWERCNS